MSKVQVSRPITGNAAGARIIYITSDDGRLTKFKLGAWMEYDNPHHRVIDMRFEVKDQTKVKVTRPLNVVTENQPYVRNGKANELQFGMRIQYDDPHH